LLFALPVLSLPTVFQLAVPASFSNGLTANLVHGIAIVVPCLYVAFLIYTVMKQRKEKTAASQDDSIIPTERTETSSDIPFVNYWFAVGLLVIIAGVTGLSSECVVQKPQQVDGPKRSRVQYLDWAHLAPRD
jgi:Ca2+/H+ antiporter